MKQQLSFIDLIDANGRGSSLSYGGRLDKGFLVVVGNLPHSAEIKPKTARDRDTLINWLKQLEY